MGFGIGEFWVDGVECAVSIGEWMLGGDEGFATINTIHPVSIGVVADATDGVDTMSAFHLVTDFQTIDARGFSIGQGNQRVGQEAPATTTTTAASIAR